MTIWMSVRIPRGPRFANAAESCLQFRGPSFRCDYRSADIEPDRISDGRSLSIGRLTLPTIFAIIHISAPLLLFHIAPIFRLNPNTAPLLVHTVTMSNTSTMPNATSWVQSRLTALYEDVSIQDTFEQAFSPACEVRLNHDVHPLQTFKDDLASRRAAATHVSVAWNTNVISTNDDTPEQVRLQENSSELI